MSSNTALQRIEYFRNCFVLIPQGGKHHQTILYVTSIKNSKNRIFCSCCRGSYAKCSHARDLLVLYQELTDLSAPDLPHESFLKSDLYKLFAPLIKRFPASAQSVKATLYDEKLVIELKGSPVQIECSRCDESMRFLERAGVKLEGFTSVDRAALLSKTTSFVYSEVEQQLHSEGHKSVRMAEEECIWFRAAYHIFRELKGDQFLIETRMEDLFTVEITPQNEASWGMKIRVKGSCVPDMATFIKKLSPDSLSFSIDDTPRKLLFFLTYPSQETISFNPATGLFSEGKEWEPIAAKNIFGSQAYLPDRQSLISFDSQSIGLLAQGWAESVCVEQKNVSSFLEKNAALFSTNSPEQGVSAQQYDLFSGAEETRSNSGSRSFDRLLNMPIFRVIDRIVIKVEKLADKWCTLQITYRSADCEITLEQLLVTRKEGKRFGIGTRGFFDCESESVMAVLPFQSVVREGPNSYTFPRSALMQFMTRNRGREVIIDGGDKERLKIEAFTEYRDPIHSTTPLKGFSSSLRPYQSNGVAWLLFLYDNEFGGLLCDDMGLGKTHQVLAFITTLKEQRNNSSPVLVVCPVSVMGHWKRLCSAFAPGLSCTIYHGQGRTVADLADFELVITSYGVLRADWPELSECQFEVAVFDEAQQLKNSDTAVSKASESLCANMKLAMSGTPVENSLTDLKRLFDIVLPGYLGTDQTFTERFIKPIENSFDLIARETLKISISPFILRRLKEDVLLELPKKIEDTRSCGLSDEQHTLYNDAYEKRGKKLAAQVGDTDQPVPYMHVFALLKYLKEVCNHPALALKNSDAYINHRSGKWELFKEILDEALGSGQKVVVFSQYLGMIEIISKYLEDSEVGHIVLTGSSRNRDKLISRFSNDEECRVFVGSLKAGGVGIDLVAASVVIHYDRWWNAAAEDQATDRVYRMGQKRGVQVFKLITENTLEEKIDKIISKKKELSSLVVSEDSPDVVKSFNREEMLELLEWNKTGVDSVELLDEPAVM